MRPDELRKIIADIDNELLQLQGCLINDSNIHRVFLARKRLQAVSVYNEFKDGEKQCQ